MGPRRADVIVVGLGAMGSAAAAVLARRGLDVVGLEQFGPAHALGSSHGETRIIRQAYFEHADYVPLLRRAYEQWRSLDGGLLHLHGGLMIGTADSAVVTGTITSATTWSIAHEVLSAADVGRRFPAFCLRPDEVAVFEPTAGYLSPEDGVRAHLAAAQRAGAQLRFGASITGWDAVGDGVEVVADGETIVADRLVVAAGAWTSKLLGERFPLRPVRRVVAYFGCADAAAFTPKRFPIYVWAFGAGDAIYGFPETSPGRGSKVGFHYRGPGVDPDLIERTVTEDEIAELRDAVAQRFTGLTGRCLDAAVCMYTMTPDEDFVVGAVPGTDGCVVVAAGFSGHGYKFAPVIGEALADVATTGTTPLPISFLSPDRF